MTWYDAKEQCENMNANLISLNTKCEANYVLELINIEIHILMGSLLKDYKKYLKKEKHKADAILKMIKRWLLQKGHPLYIGMQTIQVYVYYFFEMILIFGK